MIPKTQEAPEFTQQAALAFQQDILQAPASLKSIRSEAFRFFEETGFPTTKHEEWKYTNVRQAVAAPHTFGAEAGLSAQELEALLPEMPDAFRMVFVNGKFTPGLSVLPVAGQELAGQLTVTNLAGAAVTHESVVSAHFARLANSQQDGFAALNTAFANDGAFVHVHRNKAIAQPVVLVYVNLSFSPEDSIIAQPRNLIVVEENAQLTLIEHTLTIGTASHLVNAVSEISVAKHAHMKHYMLQDYPASVTGIATTQVHQAEESYYANTTITLGAGLQRNNLNLALDGSHCEGHMYGLYLLTGKDHVDNHTAVDHRKPNAFSNELYKGILDGRSTGVFNGKIFVRQDAQKTNAFQSNRNVLLSPQATVNTKPQLEIWADDVKCSHGATTGALDEEPMFYLRSRGISEGAARALLMFAFAADVLETVKYEPFRKLIESKIADRLSYHPEGALTEEDLR